MNIRFLFLKKFFYLYAHERFNLKRKLIVDTSQLNINNASLSLSSHELIDLKHDRVKLTNKDISSTNFNIISCVKHLKITKNNKCFIPTRVAEDICNAFVLENQEYLKEEQKIPNQLYEKIEEVFWGSYAEMKELATVFSFCLLNDINEEYGQLLQEFMLSYIPYAYNKALDELVSGLVPDYDVAADKEYYSDFPDYDWEKFNNSKKEALLLLSDRNKAKGINFMELFYQFIDSAETGLYWSTKESNEPYKTKERIKLSGKTFERFDKVMEEFIEKKIIPIIKDCKVDNDFGYRIYNIVLTDYSVRKERMKDDYIVETGRQVVTDLKKVEEYGTIVNVPTKLSETTISLKYRNREEIIAISNRYIESLMEIQLREYNDELRMPEELRNFLEHDFDRVKLFEYQTEEKWG
jgi:hypothetical protein